MSAVLTLDVDVGLFEPLFELGSPLTSPCRQPTLEAVIVDVCAELAAHRAVDCLLCGGTMAPRYGAGAVSVGGRCRECGTTLD